MTVWIVVESMFGNTRAAADEISDVVGSRMPVEVWNVADAPAAVPGSVDVLLLGGPTHVFGMSRPSTRLDAKARGASGAADEGVREWLDGVLGVDDGLLVTAFDTRVKKGLLPGSAARALMRRLHRRGCHILVAPRSFYVADTAGPLQPGERERAREFATEILDELDLRGRPPESA